MRSFYPEPVKSNLIVVGIISTGTDLGTMFLETGPKHLSVIGKACAASRCSLNGAGVIPP